MNKTIILSIVVLCLVIGILMSVQSNADEVLMPEVLAQQGSNCPGPKFITEVGNAYTRCESLEQGDAQIATACQYADTPARNNCNQYCRSIDGCVAKPLAGHFTVTCGQLNVFKENDDGSIGDLTWTIQTTRCVKEAKCSCEKAP